MRRIAGVVSFFVLAVSSTFAQTPQPLNDGGNDKKSAVVTQFDGEIRQKLNPVQAQYADELDALVKAYQPRAELDNIIAVKKEQDPFKNAGRIEQADIVTSPDELRNLQIKYKALMGLIVRQTKEQYSTKLEEQERSLTVEGRLDEALAVKNDIEQIQWGYDLADLPEASIARALVGTWFCKGSGTGTCTYSADGTAYWGHSGKWTMAGPNQVIVTCPGVTDTLEFDNPREYHWTNNEGGGGVATKVE